MAHWHVFVLSHIPAMSFPRATSPLRSVDIATVPYDPFDVDEWDLAVRWHLSRTRRVGLARASRQLPVLPLPLYRLSTQMHGTAAPLPPTAMSCCRLGVYSPTPSGRLLALSLQSVINVVTTITIAIIMSLAASCIVLFVFVIVVAPLQQHHHHIRRHLQHPHHYHQMSLLLLSSTFVVFGAISLYSSSFLS